MFAAQQVVGGSNTPPSPTVILTPVVSQLFQRNGSNEAVITVSGKYTGAGGTITSVKVSATSITGGTSIGWTVLTSSPSGQAFTGTLTVTGGWYSLSVQPFVGATGLEVGTLPKFGVGEIFVACGQSLYGCWNQTIEGAADPRSLAMDSSGNFSGCADPLPIQTHGNGSVWPTFCDALVAHLNLPVAIACTSVGGTSVAQWQPGGSYYDPYLKNAIQLLPVNGFRAVLWGQGESDGSTSQADYEGTAGVSGLRNVISQSRTDAGWAIPWGINLESNDAGSQIPAVRAAQTAVIADSNNFEVIDMDSYDPSYRWTINFPHLNTLGQTTVGAAIAAAVISQFGW